MSASGVARDVLIEANEGPFTSADMLTERALRLLTTKLWETSCWPKSARGQWQVGDYRFFIIEFRPTADACLYLQFWSEPDEPVLMEVSSRDWNPGALKYIWHGERRALEERGFVAGGQAKNFQKKVEIDSPAAAELIARETLTILFEVLGYHGGCALITKMHRGRRAEERLVYDALEVDDFMRIAAGAGFTASLVEKEARFPLIRLRCRGFHGTVILGSIRPGTSQFGSALLGVVVDGHAAMSDELVFEGGVTRQWIENSLVRWMRAARRRPDGKARKSEVARSAKRPNSPVVH